MAGYGTDQAFEAWLAANGYTLPAGAPAPAVLRQRGSAYIDGMYGARFTGQPTNGLAQERAFPRTGATAYGQAIPTDMVPTAIEAASYFAALHEAENPGSLNAAAKTNGNVKRKRIDVLETEYFEGSGDAVADATVRISAVEGLLAPFFARVEGGAIFIV